MAIGTRVSRGGTRITVGALILSDGLVGGVGASATADATYGSKDCIWPTHAFIEATTTGAPTLSITAGNGTVTSRTVDYSTTFVRNYVNSADEDAQGGSVVGELSLQSGGMGCSV